MRLEWVLGLWAMQMLLAMDHSHVSKVVERTWVWHLPLRISVCGPSRSPWHGSSSAAFPYNSIMEYGAGRLSVSECWKIFFYLHETPFNRNII